MRLESPPPATELQPVEVRYEHSQGLPALLEQLELSVLLSTYQAGRVMSVGSHLGELRLGFSHFDQAMGLCRTASGIAVGTRDGIWSLPANREIAPRIKPKGEHDIAFLARSCHHSGPLMGHDLAWGNGRLWLVNTLFNGLALVEDGCATAYVTALGETDSENGWREHKATGGCLFHVPGCEVVLVGLLLQNSQQERLQVHSGQEVVCAVCVDLALLNPEPSRTANQSKTAEIACLRRPVASG